MFVAPRSVFSPPTVHEYFFSVWYFSAHRNRIEDKEEFAKLLVKMCRENSFHTIKFSTDRGYATEIHMQVYLCEEDIEDANVVMEIDYVQREYNENYDICDNPEKFELHVDGEVIN